MSNTSEQGSQEQRRKQLLLEAEIRKQKERDAIWAERVARSEYVIKRLALLRQAIVVLTAVAAGIVGLAVGAGVISLLGGDTLTSVLVGLVLGGLPGTFLGVHLGNITALGVDWMASVLELLMSE